MSPRARLAAFTTGGIVVGVALRIWLLTGYLGTPDSDDAVVGLMARHFLAGEHTVFYWGQSHGGSLEAILAAAVFAVIGSSSLALKVVPLVLDMGSAILVWRIALRALERPHAVAAAIMFWIWPATYVWWSTKERGFYWACLVLGLVVLLSTLRIVEQPGRWLDWLVLGLAAGVGWWTSPQIAYFVLPAAAWLILKAHHELWRAPISVVAAVVGAMPWLIYNLHHQFESMAVPPQLAHGTYVDHLVTFFTAALPMAFGVMVPYTYAWVVPAVGQLLYLAALLLVAFNLRRPAGIGLVLLFAAAFPFIHAISPLSQYVDESRYLVYLAPALALLVVAAARKTKPAAAVLMTGLALTAAVLSAMAVPPAPSTFGSDSLTPVAFGPLMETLQRRGAHRAFANYWIAYRLTFESGEGVIVASTDTIRYEPYQVQVRNSPDPPVWLFVAGSKAERVFHRGIVSTSVPFGRIETGGFVVYLPARKLLPENIPPA